MATPNYDINYEDPKFTKVTDEKDAALSDLEKTYGTQNEDGTWSGGMIGASDKYFQDQISAVEKWGEEQKKNQQAKTDFAIEKIEQQKAQTQKDYIKEQSGAYTDWQKQSDPYGVDAEQKAAMGMANSGYSESSKVAMYTTYQNRVVAAREVYNRAILNYDNAIKDATLQNNAALAEIAYNTLPKSLELGLQGFQYKNTLILEKANKKTELENIYHSRWQDVLTQMNTENELSERVRQHDEDLKEKQRQHDETIAENKRQHDETIAEQKRQHDETIAEQKRQHDQDQDLKRRQQKLDEKKFEFQKSQATESSSSSGSSGGSSSGGSIKKSSSSSSSSGNTVNKSSDSSTRSGGGGKFGSSTTSAKEYLNALIASGASKDKVSNAIALALRNGAINKDEAAELRKTFTPRGVQY